MTLRKDLKLVSKMLNDATCEIESMRADLNGQEQRMLEVLATQKENSNKLLRMEMAKTKRANEELEITCKKLKHLSDQFNIIKEDKDSIERELFMLKAEKSKEKIVREIIGQQKVYLKEVEVKCEQLTEEKNFFQNRG